MPKKTRASKKITETPQEKEEMYQQNNLLKVFSRNGNPSKKRKSLNKKGNASTK